MPNSQTGIAANETVVLGHGDNDRAALCVVQAKDNTWSGTVIVKGKVVGGSIGYVPIPYKRRSLIAAASDDTIVSATITDTAFLIEIPCAGLDVELVTTTSAGTLDLEWTFVDA